MLLWSEHKVSPLVTRHVPDPHEAVTLAMRVTIRPVGVTLLARGQSTDDGREPTPCRRSTGSTTTANTVD
jgi:hypothetical protein